MQKMKIYWLLLALVPVFSFVHRDNDLIDWKANRPLVWDDYKGTPNPASDAAALTATYLAIEYEMNEKGVDWTIKCQFSKPRSWVKAKTDHILLHEQGHFDIAEIFARKLNKKMEEYKFDRNTYQKDLKAIYDGITTDKENFQQQYDKETDHSRKKEQQAEWTEKIKKTLKELDAYSDYD